MQEVPQMPRMKGADKVPKEWGGSSSTADYEFWGSEVHERSTSSATDNIWFTLSLSECLTQTTHCDECNQLIMLLMPTGDYNNHDSTSIRWPFDCSSKVIKVTVWRTTQSRWPIYLFRPQCSSPHVGLRTVVTSSHRNVVQQSNQSWIEVAPRQVCQTFIIDIRQISLLQCARHKVRHRCLNIRACAIICTAEIKHIKIMFLFPPEQKSPTLGWRLHYS